METLFYEINEYFKMIKNHRDTCNTCKHYNKLIEGHEYTLFSHARAKGHRYTLGLGQ